MFLPSGVGDARVGIDGFSLDTFRGRDSGMAPLPDFYLRYTGQKIQCFDDLKDDYEPAHLQMLESIYGDVRNVDTLTALFFESRCNNFIGKIGSRILVEQFYCYKFGDRFYYSHPNNPYPFTSGLTWFNLATIYDGRKSYEFIAINPDDKSESGSWSIRSTFAYRRSNWHFYTRFRSNSN